MPTPLPIDAVWDRIESWLNKHAPRLAARFNPPASSRQITKTERLFGVTFPDDVRRSYLRHNGHPTLFAGWEWYSLEGMRESWEVWKQLTDKGCFAGRKNSGGAAAVADDWWNPRWVPLAHLESDEICLDFAPGRTGTTGQLIEMWHDNGFRPVVAATFTGWLAEFASDLEGGRLVVCEESGELDYRESLRATLTRRGERFRQEGWRLVLDLARQFGWEPAGTRPPRAVRASKWDPSEYGLREGQQVTADDARALAAAIRRALKTIPVGGAAKPLRGASAEQRFFTGPGRVGLLRFVTFCRQGAFRISDDWE